MKRYTKTALLEVRLEFINKFFCENVYEIRLRGHFCSNIYFNISIYHEITAKILRLKNRLFNALVTIFLCKKQFYLFLWKSL